MRRELDFEVEVARRPATEAGRALAREADLLPGTDALRNRDLQLALAQRHLAGVVEFGAVQRQFARRAVKGVLERDDDLGMVVLPAHRMAAMGWRPRVPRRRCRTSASKNALWPASADSPGPPLNSKPASQPGGGRNSWPPCAALADLVVGGALFLVAQHLVGLVEFLHAGRASGALLTSGWCLRARRRKAFLMSASLAVRSTPSTL